MNEVKGKIPSITNLAATVALTDVENKISNVSKNLLIVQKLMKLKNKTTDHDHSNKYITTQIFNRLTSQNFAARLVQANLASKNDIANFVKKTDSDDKLKKLNKNLTSSKKELN